MAKKGQRQVFFEQDIFSRSWQNNGYAIAPSSSLSSFHGGEFDEYFDDSILKRTAPMEDVLDHTEIFKGRGLENERDRLVKSVLNIFEE